MALPGMKGRSGIIAMILIISILSGAPRMHGKPTTWHTRALIGAGDQLRNLPNTVECG